jgi:hypothetical protein
LRTLLAANHTDWQNDHHTDCRTGFKTCGGSCPPTAPPVLVPTALVTGEALRPGGAAPSAATREGF